MAKRNIRIGFVNFLLQKLTLNYPLRNRRFTTLFCISISFYEARFLKNIRARDTRQNNNKNATTHTAIYKKIRNYVSFSWTNNM